MTRFYHVIDKYGHCWTNGPGDWLLAVREGQDKYQRAIEVYGSDAGWTFKEVSIP